MKPPCRPDRGSKRGGRGCKARLLQGLLPGLAHPNVKLQLRPAGLKLERKMRHAWNRGLRDAGDKVRLFNGLDLLNQERLELENPVPFTEGVGISVECSGHFTAVDEGELALF